MNVFASALVWEGDEKCRRRNHTLQPYHLCSLLAQFRHVLSSSMFTMCIRVSVHFFHRHEATASLVYERPQSSMLLFSILFFSDATAGCVLGGVHTMPLPLVLQTAVSWGGNTQARIDSASTHSGAHSGPSRAWCGCFHRHFGYPLGASILPPLTLAGTNLVGYSGATAFTGKHLPCHPLASTLVTRPIRIIRCSRGAESSFPQPRQVQTRRLSVVPRPRR